MLSLTQNLSLIRSVQLLTLIFVIIAFIVNIITNIKLREIAETTQFMACDAYAYDQESAPEFCK